MNNSYPRINEEVVEILKQTKAEPAFEGTIKEGCECKYTIINLKDLEKYIGIGANQDLVVILDHVQGNIEHGREEDGKKPFNNYIVINIDEPYIKDIVRVLEDNGHWDGQPSGVMRFYEVHDPYYSLIMAQNEESAMGIYTEIVADDDGTLIDEIKEVSRDYALLRISRATGEDNKLIEYKELLDSLNSNEPHLFIIDGSLI